MWRIVQTAVVLVVVLLGVGWASAQTQTQPVHGIAMHGEVKYGSDFKHFAYADPIAPKGGTWVLSAIGSFDSLNSFILKGIAAEGLELIYETLMVPGLDEPFARYGFVAESVEMPADRRWVAFNLRPEARWHDGKPITVEDVIFSFETLMAKGHPRYRQVYADVAKVEKTGDRRVVFHFAGNGENREMPLIMGDLPILPKHWWEGRDFERSSLDVPLGSGSYKVASVDPGRSITYERVADHWAANLPVIKGRYNYDRVRYEYYRDSDVALEAFKAGQFDFRAENSAKRWATGYTGPAVDKGLIKVEKLMIPPPARMQGYIFNLRQPKFQDRRVREAMAYAFDFEWSNKALMYDAYVRIVSYFHGEPELMAKGLPSADELKLLEPFRDRLPPEVFTAEYKPPSTDGSGNIRDNLRKALRLLREAGWEVKDGALTNTKTGERMAFEMLFFSSADERLAAPFAQNLEKLGIKATIRIVDPAQYQKRMDEFDFEVTTDIWPQSSSPGNEQRDFWGSAAAAIPGSRNTIGIKDPVIDALIDRIVKAPDRDALEVACRALDRVLLWGHYQVPHFTDNGYRIAYWDRLNRPAVLPTEGLDLFTWWIDPAKDQTIVRRKEEVIKSTN